MSFPKTKRGSLIVLQLHSRCIDITVRITIRAPSPHPRRVTYCLATTSAGNHVGTVGTLGVPSYNYSIMGPTTLFELTRPLY